MKIKDSPTWEHHVRTWGTDFRYEDFIPIFMKESRKWKPEEWAALFEETGARYVVFTTKRRWLCAMAYGGEAPAPEG